MRHILPLTLLLFSLPALAQEGAALPSGPEPHQSTTLTAAETAITETDWKRAEGILTPWLATHPDDARALFDLGYIAEAQGQDEKASELYQRAIAADPKSLEARLALGLLFVRQGKATEARPLLEAATRLSATGDEAALKARAWRALAALDQESNPERAADELLEALRLSPESPADMLLTGLVAERAGQPDLAETAYRRLLKIEPNSPQANAGLAHLLIAKKQYAEAEGLLRTALAEKPDDPAMTTQLALALDAENKPEAIELVRKLRQSQPQDPDIARLLARLLAKSGDLAAADKIYMALLSTAPEDPRLLSDHAQILVRLARFEEAYQVFDEATQIDPANGEAWGGLAYAALQINRPAEALHALTKRALHLPESASTYFLWATAYDALHEKKNALSYYRFFLNSAAGRFPQQEEQVRQRIAALEGRK